MSLLLAPDAQDQNSSSANQTSSRSFKARIACEECRSRKAKCDGDHPCKGCRHNNIECVYQKAKPSELERGLTGLRAVLVDVKNTLREIRGEVQQLRDEMKEHCDILSQSEGLNRGDSGSHFVPLDLGQESVAKAFSHEELHRLSKSYIEHVHPLHPFFDKPQQMCDEFINDPSVQRGSGQSVAKSTCHSSTMPGTAYYSCAEAIFKYKLGERDIRVAQALTLAALYTNQNGMLHDSLTYLRIAQYMYIDVVKNNKFISDEAKRSIWIHWDLACGINNCFNWSSFGPFPTSVPEEKAAQSPEGVYRTRITLQMLLDGLRRSACRHLKAAIVPDEEVLPDSIAEEDLPDPSRRPYPQVRGIDEEDLRRHMCFAKEHISLLEEWRSHLDPRLAWEDTELPSTNPLTASLRAEYYEGGAHFLKPFLDVTMDALHSNAGSIMEETSEGQQKILQVLLDWEKYALSSIVCFDRVGAASDSEYEMYQNTSGSSVMLSNPISTLHAISEKVLLFRALRSSKVHPLMAKQTTLTDEKVDKLHHYTIKRLSGFRPSHPILTRDLETLNRLQLSGVSVPWELVSSCYWLAAP